MAAPEKKVTGEIADSARRKWRDARRIVVKIGSALLVDRDTGRVRATWLNSLADDIAALRQAGKQVVLVSSGSIALGRHILGLPSGPLELEQSQAAASVGQISLAHAYQGVFQQRGLTMAQILLTLGDTEERRRYLNARHTFDTLLAHGAVPVVNENDTVATTEIRYGDEPRGWPGDVSRFAYDLRKIHALGWNTGASSDEAMRRAARDIFEEQAES